MLQGTWRAASYSLEVEMSTSAGWGSGHGRLRLGNGASGRGPELLEVELAVAQQRLAQGQSLVVVADRQLVGHAHPAVQLDGLAADESRRARCLHLRRPHGALGVGRVVIERLQRRVHDGSRLLPRHAHIYTPV